MSNRLIAGLAALALVFAGLLAWYISTLQTRTVHYVTPARNAAAYNPLFVLEQALQALGHPSSSHRYYGRISTELLPGDTVVMLADGSQLNATQAGELGEAVHRGVHLIALQPQRARDGAAAESGPLLDALDIQLQASADCTEKTGCHPQLGVADDQRILLQRADHLALRTGQGRVDLLHDLAFLQGGRIIADREKTGIDGFHNTGLARPAHREQAWRLLAPNLGQGHVYLIYSQREDRWWMRLLANGVMTWLPLALLLAGWLWARSQRLGPLLPEPEPARRSLREHIIASAHHLWRNGRGLTLYDQALASLHTRIATRAPALSGLHGVALEQALALRTGMDAQRLATALRRPAAHDKTALAQRITVLMETRNLL